MNKDTYIEVLFEKNALIRLKMKSLEGKREELIHEVSRIEDDLEELDRKSHWLFEELNRVLNGGEQNEA